ncbi:MAG: response regulator [Ramlibacter sp.]|nr:response regulator [Ramlibacter sp.]
MPRRSLEPLWSFRTLAILSVAVPLLIYTSLGAFRFAEARDGAEQRVSRSLRVAHEHAAKVLGGAEALQDRIFDLVDGKTRSELANASLRLHQALRARTAGQKQIHSIWIIDAEGKPIATSMAVPAPAIDLSDRAYFQFHRSGSSGRYLSEPIIAKLSGDRILDISLRFNGADGGFGGVINVSLFSSYFEQFYSDLVADEPGLAVNLFRQNGPVYTRWPVIGGAPDRLGASSPILQRVVAGEVSGQLRGTSSFDGQDRLLAFKRIGSYPLFVGTGMNMTQLRSQLVQEMAVLLALGLPPFAALFFAARVALRRTREAVEAAYRLRAEISTRERAEAALLQAQKLEAMGRLTGGVAHDFNNALMVISNNAFLLQRHVAAAGEKQLLSIGRAVDSATKLTRQLLAFSRRQALLPELVTLQQKLPTTRELIAPVLGGQVALAIEVAPDTAPVTVDSAELELALLNLAINARDAMPSGGSFKIVAGNATEGIPQKLHGPVVLIAAVDTGTGIAPDLLDKVFEPFFTTKPLGQGTGLGLSQVYGLCERAGGAAAVESIVGEGTTVRLFFPAAQAGQGPAQSSRQPVNRRLERSVLVVEDNNEVASALLPLLEALGCTVARVDSAAAALEWLAVQESRADLVLTDVMMPGEMDGMALARRLRAEMPGLPVLLMTGYAERIDAATSLGFEVLPKPCSPEVLSAAIARATPNPGRAAGESAAPG